MAVKTDKRYNVVLAKFCQRLQADQIRARQAKSLPDAEVVCYHETGRKFDKIVLSIGDRSDVRYFVQRSDGSIYGSKSKFAPNTSWYFGTIYNADKWDWADYHGAPINDNSVRLAKKYGGYSHFMKIEP